jgi:NADH dehydrogenase
VRDRISGPRSKLFQPLLYQVATGSLSPGEVAAPLRSVLSRQKNARVLLGEVLDIDPSSREVVLADGARLGYDSLIVAAGSRSHYFGHDAWRESAPSLKSVEEATDIRHKVLYAFEAAEWLEDAAERRAWLTFVIVGAGATGVELAGAIAEIARQTLKHDFRSIHPEEARIILMDGGPRVLPAFPDGLAEKATASLAKLGVGDGMRRRPSPGGCTGSRSLPPSRTSTRGTSRSSAGGRPSRTCSVSGCGDCRRGSCGPSST